MCNIIGEKIRNKYGVWQFFGSWRVVIVTNAEIFALLGRYKG
jgi:hypothetical protein